MENRNETNLRGTVRERIMELIGHMDFTFSTQLLSENKLAARLEVSRSTVRSVLAELEREGKIIRRHGSGTYVNPPALTVETTLHPNVSMYELVTKNGYSPSVETFSVQETRAGEEGEELGLLPNEKLLEMRSCYYADGKPALYCIDLMDAQLYSGIDWKKREKVITSLHDFIRENTDIVLSWDIIRIKAAHSGMLPELNPFFQVPEGEVKPLVLLKIRNFDQYNRTTLLGRIYIDTDLIGLSMVRDLNNRKKEQ